MYRLYVIAAIPQLVKLDSAVVTHLERNNSEFKIVMNKKKRLPRLEIPIRPETPKALRKEI